ncbi:MAG: 4Fe-4S ferredoxin, partial [Gammaproteobacteria bacterium]|nr:4Fe-4S ferredoxin [Gammaproteobacteria bacterium]
MNSNIIDIYYFSGTGNTLLITKKIATILKQHGKEVNLFNIQKTAPQSVNPTHALGLAFPVAAFSTYPFVWNFINNLPRGQGTEAFMLDTLAGFSGGIVGPLKKALLNKSYLPIGAKEFIMPSNYGRLGSKEKN